MIERERREDFGRDKESAREVERGRKHEQAIGRERSTRGNKK